MQGLRTDPLYLDVELPARARFSHPVKPDYNAFLYAYEGGIEVGPAGGARPLKTHSAGVLSAGDRIEVAAGADGARFILLAGRPLREPVVQYGPFVMNTREEIEQAIRDYQNGRLTTPA
jgi:redox-sensitive bicupin YhaK (pirin superfamily)